MKKLLFLAGCVAVAVLLIWKLFAGASAPEAAVFHIPPPAFSSAASEITDESLPILVNSSHSVSGEPAKLMQAYPAVSVKETGIMLHPDALEALKAMFDAAKKENIEGLYLSSGYRSYDEQKQIYEQAQDKRYVQPPDHSEHQTGLAADILALDVSMERFGNSKQGRWLAQNAWHFGFILRYPEGKEHITGIAYEPWHFRYIGQPHAQVCFENNLCLEEYLQK